MMKPVARAGILAAFVFGLVHATGGAAGAADWQAGAGPEWAKVLAAAKKEGSVTVTGHSNLAKGVTEGFERDTGIKMNYGGGPTRETFGRMVRELRAHNVSIDAHLTGTAAIVLAHGDFYADLSSRLLLPGVTDLKNWKDGELKYNDNARKYMLQGAQYRSGIPYINTKAFPNGFKSWQELLDPKFKGKIVAYDPRTGGPGQGIASFIAAQFGFEYFEKLYRGQEVVYSRDTRQMAEWVAQGVHSVGLGIIATSYLRLNKAGIDTIAPGEPQDVSGTLSGGYSVIVVPKEAPHPNAAIVFLNWYLSQPGQEVYSRAFKVPSRRLDVKVDGIPDYVIPKQGAKYQEQYNEDWAMSGRKKVLKKVVEILGGK